LIIIVSDSEGSYNIEKSASVDAKVLSLSLLISSCFIYNSLGVIDESTINDLSLMTQIPKYMALEKRENLFELGSYCPKFLWVLRDLNLYQNPNQYLERALLDQVNKQKIKNCYYNLERGPKNKSDKYENKRESSQFIS